MAADAKAPLAASHARRVSLPVLVAPSTTKELNVLGHPPVPIACWRLEDVHFDFDSSFVKPSAADPLASLASLWESHNHPPIGLFGHADPIGDDEYNKTLSGRRARAVYGLLTANGDHWEQLYSQPFSGDTWGRNTIEAMVAQLGFATVADYQQSKGLPPDGSAGTNTRKFLFPDYINSICRHADGSAFRIDKESFFAKGVDAEGKGDYQGCSEFNPLMLFSKDEYSDYSQPNNKDERDARNAVNRRVMAFFFTPGLVARPEDWPCPRAKESSAGCRKLFWPDGNQRRTYQDDHRTYSHDQNTFACAFYDAMARRSPCEGRLRPWKAYWDRDQVGQDVVAELILEAPGLAAETAVEFVIMQEGYGPIAQLNGTSTDGRCSVCYVDWDHDPDPPFVELQSGEEFPVVKYSFVARAVYREIAAPAVPYADTIQGYLYDDEGALDCDTDYLLHSPWGSRPGRSAHDGAASEQRLPPGGAAILGALGAYLLKSGT